jgi:hypothetical protein
MDYTSVRNLYEFILLDSEDEEINSLVTCYSLVSVIM